MTNLKNYNFSGIDCRLDNSEYYDFYLNTDALTNYGNPSYLVDNLISSFAFSAYSTNISEIISDVSWVSATTSSFTAYTYGLTGLDNGAIGYIPEIDDYAHTGLTSILTGSTLIGVSGNSALILNQVSGYSGNYVYPLELVTTTASTGNYVRFCGGFYQGYYKLDGYDYEVLPNRYQDGWTIDTWLMTGSTCSSGNTLNDTYPNNKGFFFYIGTRAENKFWNVFTGNTLNPCTTGTTTGFCTTIKETDVDINNIMIDGSGTTISVPLSPPPIDVTQIRNNFLLFGRSDGILCGNQPSKDGYGQIRADRYFDRNQIFYSRIVREETTNFLNPFLIFGRSDGVLCGNQPSEDGYGQVRADRNFSGMTTPVLELDKDNDLINNALGFRITDEGKIGYKLLNLSADCKSVEVIEEYSEFPVITGNTWAYIAVKWVNNDSYNKCELANNKARKGKFKFYVNSMLVFVSQELDELIFKRLDDLSEKQVAVPYNISIGGGSQGLLESMTFDGQDPNDLGLIIEENFAGSFIGSISSFNIYDKKLSWCEIKNNYNINLSKYL